jgi:P4 family phage/plasmid primase-like protien
VAEDDDGELAKPAVRVMSEEVDMAPCWKHSTQPGSWIFRRGDSYYFSRVFKHAIYPRGLINLLGVWWTPGDNFVWQMLDHNELQDAIYRFSAVQFWAGAEGKIHRVSANARLTQDILHALSAGVSRASKSPFDGIPLRDGKLDVMTGKVTPFTLEDFVTWTLPFHAADLTRDGAPSKWLNFLHQGFSDQDIELLQEFFGYCLSGSTKHQRSLWIYGDPGCGKSIIFKVLIAIVGRERTTIRKSENFKSNFNGDLLGKRLIYFPDYRHDPASAKAALSFLLTVAGDDPIQIERKYKEAVHEMLMGKIVWSSNDMPVFPDSTGASLRRFLVIHRKKHEGIVEDPNLTDSLLAEAPQILQWATIGAKRLALRGRFDADMLDGKLMRHAARSMNATYAFLEDACMIGPGVTGQRVAKQTVFDAWRAYAAETGHHQRYNRETFAASLMQSAAQLGTKVKGADEDFVNINVRSKYLKTGLLG